MMQVTCDKCGKVYKVDENKIKGEKARLKCKSCENIIIVTKPKPEEIPLHNRAITPSAPPMREDAAATEESFRLPYGKTKVKFGLFTKIILVMLIVSLLPLTIFWWITFKETDNRVRSDTELLMTLTAQGLGSQVENWIENNVWVGDSAIICKGVTLGENSVIGAGAVVANSVPPNCIVAGNPARVVKELDEKEKFTTREQWFADPEALFKGFDYTDKIILRENSLFHWLRYKLFPSKKD